MWLLVALVVSAICLYRLLLNSFNFWTLRGVQQAKPWIFFGDTWGMMLRRMDMAEMTVYNYKLVPDTIQTPTRYYGLYQFSKPKLVIRDPELIRKVLVKDFDHFTDHTSMVDPQADPLFARNLLSLKGDEWRKMRSTLTTSFTSSKMKIMFNLVLEAAENFTKHFQKLADKRIVEVEMKDAFTRFTIDVIATTSFGVKVDSLAEPNNDFFTMGKEISELNFKAFLKIMFFLLAPKLYKLCSLGVFRKEVNDFFRNLINDTINTRTKNDTYRPDMIQILMEAQKEASDGTVNITNEDITAQALIFFFAGFDSVSSLMTFLAYELAINPGVQDKLRKEVQKTREQCNGTLTHEAVINMEYMDMVISEALRKWPPFVIIGRECTKAYTIEPILPNERVLTIPKGMSIQIPAYAIQRDPRYYENPDKFIPERFSAEQKKLRNPYVFLPFGQGPRSCLGTRFALMETKIIFFNLLSNFKLVAIERTEKELKLSKKFSINIRPENGCWIGLEQL